MNLLPIALVFALFLSNKNSDIKSILNNFSSQDICEILNFLGIEQQFSTPIANAILQFSNNNAQFFDLAKTFLPLLISYFSSTKNKENFENLNESHFEFEDIASQEISQKLKNYFS